VAGGSARPLGATVRPPGATAPLRTWQWDQAVGLAPARAGRYRPRWSQVSGSACITACRWGQRVVVTWRFVIGLFEYDFARLN
jgi:hypothetical protein